MIVLRKKGSRLYDTGTADEGLGVLKWLADVMASDEESGARSRVGLNFLHVVTTNGPSGDLAVLALDNNPSPLSDPGIISRLRLQPSTSLPAPVPSTLQNVRLLAAELILGLLFLHENGIVHKDVKPDNVLISPTGHALITGFGAANVLPRASTATVPKLYGPIVRQPRGVITFNPPYAAPELFETTYENLLEYDERVDFYSLGALLSECATGSPPLGSVVDIGCEGDVTSWVPENLADPAAGKVSEVEKAAFRNFVKQLLVRNARDRLSGPAVKSHPFFEPIVGVWEDIASLRYPPLPNPVSNHLGLGVSLDCAAEIDWKLESGIGCSSSETEIRQRPSSREGNSDIETGGCVEDGQLSPKSSRGHEALWLRRSIKSNRSSEGSEYGSAGSREGVVPDYIIPWITGPNARTCEAENGCHTSLVGEGSSVYLGGNRVPDSGLVTPEDMPPPRTSHHRRLRKLDEPRVDSRKGSPSPSFSSASSYSSTFSEFVETDDELLSAVENYRRLEELLASGSYFTDYPPREDARNKKMSTGRQDVLPQRRVRLVSGGLSAFPPRNLKKKSIAVEEPEVDISGFVTDSIWSTLLEGDQTIRWSFEDEITMAVLDAMEDRRVSVEAKETEFGVIDEQHQLAQPKRETRKQSLRRTLATIKRRFRATKTV